MTLPIRSRRSRWTLALCLGLVPSAPWAAASDWNCTRGKDNKQWVCRSSKPEAAAPESVPAEAVPSRIPAEPPPPSREAVRPAEPEAPARAETPPHREPPVRAETPSRVVSPVPAETPARAETPVPREAPAEPAPTRRAAAPPAAPEIPPRTETPARRETPAEARRPLATRTEPPAPQEPQAITQARTPVPEPQPRSSSAEKPPRPAPAVPLKRVPETVQPRAPEPKLAAASERSGWTCRAGEADETGRGWDCSLTGADPRGMVHVVGEGGEPTVNWAESDTITREDEQRFQKMMGLLPADPWENVCTASGRARLSRRRPPPVAAFQVSDKDREARQNAPTEISSDYFEMLDGEVANFSGTAAMVKADQKLWGDFITRNTVTNALNAHGSVVYLDKGYAVSSDSGFLDADTSRGVFRNSQFILPQVPARGTSRLTHLDSNTLSRYETFTYTSCPPGDQDWMLHASNVKINKETGTGSARSAWVEFKGVPFFYTPYMSFPVDQRRQSGFLAPSFGQTSVSGFSFQAPYYFNLAPNYDYTVTPRYLTQRGFQLKNEFRYMTETTRGRIEADIVPYDPSAKDKPEDDTPTTRGQAAWLNNTRFTDKLIGHVDANYVSDSRYLNQLGSPLSLVDRNNIRSVGYLSYADAGFSARTQIDYYQSINPTIIAANAQPYFHLPEIALGYGNTIADTGLQFDAQAIFDGFDTSASNRTTGQRLKLRPRISYPYQRAAGFVVPSMSLMHNQYWLNDPGAWTDSQQAAWAAIGQVAPGNVKAGSSESLTVPIFSVDSGLYFEREFDLGQTPLLQTLEPRLYYVYIPKVNQNNIPVFDSSLYDYTYYQLFRENRFTGSDRVGDANDLTAALTSRLVDQETGLERLRATLGNAIYFENHEVTLAGPAPKTQSEDFSNLIGDVYAGITNHWSLHTGGQYNPVRNQIDRGIVALQYNNRQNEILNLAYRYRRNQYTLNCPKGDPNNGCIDLTDVSMRLPIAEGWHVIGRWQYSLLDQVTVESFAGIERETCCWRFTLLGRHYINNISAEGNNQANNGIFFQFELKGLTALGDEVDQFLARSVAGYRYDRY